MLKSIILQFILFTITFTVTFGLVSGFELAQIPLAAMAAVLPAIFFGIKGA